MSYEIKRFDPDSIPLGSVCVWVGGRATGKSTNMMYTLYRRRKLVERCIVMSGTNASNGQFDGHVPRSFIYDAYEPDVIANLIEFQERTFARDHAYTQLGIEDLFWDMQRIKRDRNFTKILMTSRHIGIDGPHMSVQYLMDFPVALRSQVDFWFFTKENKHANRRRIHEHVCGVVKDYDTFDSIMQACTENHSVMVVDNRSKSYDITDQIFWYRAPPPDKMPSTWHIGSKRYWKKGLVPAKRKPQQQ